MADESLKVTMCYSFFFVYIYWDVDNQLYGLCIINPI